MTKSFIQLHIGIDDTDSLSGNCTTYVAARIIEYLSNFVKFSDYPRLIRNNPNIPWKTRGNGAIAISFKVEEKYIDEIISFIFNYIKDNHEHDINTNPGCVIIKGEVPLLVREFSKRALISNIKINEAKELIKDLNLKSFHIGNGRGLIGALAALGNELKPSEEDFTYELLTYRRKENIGKKRLVSEESVHLMDKELYPFVFNNIDEEKNKSIIAPAGKDPVLYGIRGENAEILLKALKIVKTYEEIERYCIFRTNQGTDQHFKFASSKIEKYSVFKGEIEVQTKPTTILGGHVFFKGKILDSGKIVDVAAFEPTKKFRLVVKQLLPNDRIIAFGGVQVFQENVFTIQLEKMIVTHVAEQYKELSPLCPQCGKRMTSAGFSKGHKCKKCGYKDRNSKKIRETVYRELKKGLYIPPAGSQRHLVKPHRRYSIENSRENKIVLINNWWRKNEN
ncbi:MAG: tRNA(Ile)(2)-agmatinylcytidine synthase [Candidatus Heimdallarchaeum aukensis]|uniref:tRNA(Ile2) 2-agmatinylcytidine synthetase TiaS n=1 Tax=Candidatus Heimdallarchaeum aukensis TaxID=2876573 RepID=A0A9Y1FK64_9ARCH|nr:MAG: tRNA(Ile)(2)-agmatinylcytidine synthase [Candidatus Heimdallarchaeum aukensis]